MFSTLFEGDKQRVESETLHLGEAGPAQHFRQQKWRLPILPFAALAASNYQIQRILMLPFGNMASDKFRRKAQICRRLQQYSFLKPKSHEIAQPVQCPFIPHAQRG